MDLNQCVSDGVGMIHGVWKGGAVTFDVAVCQV